MSSLVRLKWLLLLACLLLPVSRASAEPIVLVLSWDGMRHDYMDRANFPGLARMEREGVRANFIPVFPSNTFPTHVSMATGVPPGEHGVMDNQFLDRKRGRFRYSDGADWLDAEPIWAAAERQGRKAALYYWVGSGTAWRGRELSYQVSPFNSGMSESRKVDQLIKWLDLPESRRPSLIMSYWRGADRAGHNKGPNDPAVAQQVGRQDAQLLRLLAALDKRDLWAETTLLLVSDHGMTEVRTAVSPITPLREQGIGFDFTPATSLLHIFLHEASDLKRAEAVARKTPHTDLLSRSRLKELGLLHPTRTGDLVLQVRPPHVFGIPGRKRSPGYHGYHGEHPDMAALFLALGRGVATGKRLGAVSQLDLVPTIAALLAMEPPAGAQGAPIPLD